MTIIRKDLVAEGLARATTYFKDKPHFLNFLTVLLDELQNVNDSLIELSKIKDLNTVVGVWLDYLGKIVGEDRKGREDEVYRRAIRLKIAVNNSDGTPNSVYEIIKTYTDSDRVRVAEGIYSYGQLIFDGDTDTDITLYDLVQEVIPVSTYALIVQNTNKKSFFPAYEWEVSQLDLFQAFTGGVTETLKVVLSTNSEEVPLYVRTGSEGATLDPDTIGAEVLEWEDAEGFFFNTGEPWEFTIEGITSQFEVEGATGTTINNSTLLPWEINEDMIEGDDNG